MWPAAPASATGDPEEPDCVWIHAYLNDGSQVLEELCDHEDPDRRARGNTVEQRKKNYLASLRINWGVDTMCSGAVGDADETSRSGCYYEYDPDDTDGETSLNILKDALETPGVTGLDKWRKDRLTTKTVTLTITSTLDCSLTKAEFRKRYGDLGGAVNEQRQCDPATVGIPGTVGAHIAKPTAGAKAAGGGKKGSGGGEGDIGAIRRPESYNAPPAGNSGTAPGEAPGEQSEPAERQEAAEDPAEQQQVAPDNGVERDEPAEQPEPADEAPGGGIEAATEGSTADPQPEPEPEAAREPQPRDCSALLAAFNSAARAYAAAAADGSWPDAGPMHAAQSAYRACAAR